MSGNKEIQRTTITSGCIKRMAIESMTGLEKVGVSIKRRGDLRTIDEMAMLMPMGFMHRGALDLQEAAMSRLGIERNLASKMVMEIQKWQSPGIGETKREKVLAGQSVTGIEVGR